MSKKKSLFNPDDFKIDIPAVQEVAEQPAESVVPEVVEPTPAPKAEAPKPAKQKDPAKKAMPIYLTEEQYAYLSYKARRSKITMNSLIRELIASDMAANPDVVKKSKDFI